MSIRNLCVMFIAATLSCLPFSFDLGSAQAQRLSPTSPPVSPSGTAVSSKLIANYGKMPLRFEANRGQTDPRAQFVSRGQGYTLFLTSSEAVLELAKPTVKQTPSSRLLNAMPDGTRSNSAPSVVHLQFVGANENPVITHEDELVTKSNYFIGNDASKWRTNIPNYSRVRYHNIYPGVDLVYYGNQRQLEHDFVVSPYTDPSLISLRVRGADRLRLDSGGNLLLMTQEGVLRLEKPIIYQMVGENRQTITGRFRLNGKNTIGFTIAKYNHHLPLIIDPILSYSTYLGGSGDDYAFSIAVDGDGNAYVAGSTTSLDFPAGAAFQSKIGGGTSDGFVTRIRSDGSLMWSTYLGGSGADGVGANDLVTDSSGDVYIAGSTTSLDFPVSANAFQKSYGGGQNDSFGFYWGDGFVTKLSPNGDSLIYSTYLGGNSDDCVAGIALDGDGYAYVSGGTFSTNFPMKDAFQSTFGGTEDAFIAKLAPDGTAILFSTYLGGWNGDIARGIARASDGTIYVIGWTAANNSFPTLDALQATPGGGNSDAFFAVFSSSGVLLSSSYLGGYGDEDIRRVVVDTSGNVYLAGTTTSPNFPMMHPFQGTFTGSSDGYITKISHDGSAILYSTLLGGSKENGIYGLTVDGSGDMYCTGYTSSVDLPTKDAFQSSYAGGAYDAFVTSLTADGSALRFSSYLGGTGDDWTRGIAVDAQGNAYVAGYTNSADFPTVNAFQGTFAKGAYDAFVTKIASGQATPILSATPTTLTFTVPEGSSAPPAKQITIDNKGGETLDWTASATQPWLSLDANSGTAPSTINVTVDPTGLSPGTYHDTITISATGVSGSPVTIPVTLTVTAAPVLTVNQTSLTFNATAGGVNPTSQALLITNTGGGTLTWTASKTQSWLSLDTSSGTAPSAVNASVNIAGLAPGTYHDTITISATGASGSPLSIPVTLTVTENTALSVSPLSLTFTATVGGGNPAAQPVTIANTGSGTLAWTASKTQSWLSLDNASGTAPSTIQISVNIAGLAAGTYQDTITITATGASNSPQAVAVTLTVSPVPDFKTDTPSGGNYSATVTAGGTASYGLEEVPLNGFTGAIGFACSGLPSKSTCSFNPASANITSSASVPFAVAIATTATTTSVAGIATGLGGSRLGILAGTIIVFLNFWLLVLRTRRWRRLMMLVLLVCSFGTISCGGGGHSTTTTTLPGTPAGTYTVVLTSTSGSITHTTNLTLTVQ